MQCFDFEISGKILRTLQVGFFFKWVTVVFCAVLYFPECNFTFFY